MPQILLSQNRVARVDDLDHARLGGHKWSYRAERNGSQGYAVRHVPKEDGGRKLEYLHRAIMNPPPGTEVIFLNHDRLDCRRENLRVVSKEEARRHHRVRRDSKSGIKGVRYNPDTLAWTAELYRGGRCHYLGSFPTREQASRAYEVAERRSNPELFGAGPG